MLNDDSMIGPQDSILFHQIRDHVLQVPTEPGGEGGPERSIVERDGVSSGSVRQDDDRRAMRPLGIAPAAHQTSERLLSRRLDRKYARAGVFGRDEQGGTDGARLVPLRCDMSERDGQGVHETV